MEITVVDQQNKPIGKRALNPAVFGLESDEEFVHRVYTALAAGQRAGTHATKTRAFVSGGGKKPYKQKGTGRARQGSTRATQWRHGAIAHGPQPRSYATRINKRERQRAVCMALSNHLSAGSLVVVDKIELPEIKTKEFVRTVAALAGVGTLLVLAEENRNVMLSGRNAADATIVLDGRLTLRDLLKCKHLVVTDAAVSKLEQRLS